MSDMFAKPKEASLVQPDGIAAAAKYNPHLWSPAELRAIFVARQRELATILQALRAAEPNSAPQHLLITGQRGMGKSTLLQRVALAVEDEPALSQQWLPLRFPEEQYTVSTPAELWANVIGALADALERQGQPTLKIDAELAQLMQLPIAQREQANLSWLQNWCQTHQKRLLLLIDSTDLLFANIAAGDAKHRSAQQDGGASALWRVRKALLHAPHLLWLGGSYQPLEAHGLYSDAFLDFFQLIELRPLTLSEMQSAIQAMAFTFGAGRGLRGEAAENEVKRLLNERPERLRAMHQLTGGNPRTTVMLYELFAAGGRDNMRADLERLLDVMTPLYKAKLEVLADQTRKILAHVMENWAPITAKNLARVSALPVGTVSAQLTRLEQEGLIEKTPMSGTKRSGFQAAERFFNIWYLMRNAARGSRARVGWLVEFMRLWYSRDELQGLARNRISEHRDGRYCDGAELEYSRAIARAMPKEAQDRRQLEWTVFQQARKSSAFSDLFELEGEDAIFQTPDDYLRRFEALRPALQLAPLPEDAKLAWAHEVMSSLTLTLAQKEKLAKQSDLSSTVKLKKYRAELLTERNEFVKNNEQNNVTQVEIAVANGEFFPDCPDSTLAYTQMQECFTAYPHAFVLALTLLIRKWHDAPAKEACKRAIDLVPDSARAWDILGFLHSRNPKCHKEAEAAYRKAIALNPEWSWPWDSLADLLSNDLKRHAEAESAYRKAIELDPKSGLAWFGLANLLRNNLNRYEDAEAAYRKAIELEPELPQLRGALAELLCKNLERYDEAELAYHKAIDLDPTSAFWWDCLAGMLETSLMRYEDAESAYRKAIALKPEWVLPWCGLGGLLYLKLKRNEEAEVIFRKAIALAPEFAWSQGALGHVLVELKRYDEAETAYRKAIELDAEWGDPWNNLGELLQDKLKQYDQAEWAYRKAIECDQLAPSPKINLARLLAKLDRKEEASELYRQTLTLATPTDYSFQLQAHCWLGNQDMAMQALDALAEDASANAGAAFTQLKEQCFECHGIGLSLPLARLMEGSRFAGLLQPLSLALRAANGETDGLLDVAVEVRAMAEEVLLQITG